MDSTNLKTIPNPLVQNQTQTMHQNTPTAPKVSEPLRTAIGRAARSNFEINTIVAAELCLQIRDEYLNGTCTAEVKADLAELFLMLAPIPVSHRKRCLTKEAANNGR